MIWRFELPYFGQDELADPDTGRVRLDMRFAAAFPALRHSWGAPLYVTSVCRSQAHNESIGGHPRSLHLMDNPEHDTDGTMAADIAWSDWPDADKRRFARLAWSQGWSVGLSDAFCHVDRRVDIGLAQHVFDYGGDWSQPFDKSEVRP